MRGGRNRGRATVRLHIRRFLSLRLPNLAPFFVSEDPAVTGLTSPRGVVWVWFPRAFPRGGEPRFSCRVSSPRNAAAAAAAGWLASEKRNSLFSLHCGRDSHGRARLFSACVCFFLSLKGLGLVIPPEDNGAKSEAVTCVCSHLFFFLR